jgi:hypothetical protein
MNSICKKRPYVVIGDNDEIYNVIKKLAVSHNFRISILPQKPYAFAIIQNTGNDHYLDCSGLAYYQSSPKFYEEVNLATFIGEIEKHGSTHIEVKINDSYTATVKKDVIVVGCQKISHDVIEELYKASLKIRE